MNDAVRAERERRGLSVRSVALAGGVSNTTWSRFEDGGNLTGKMRNAVAGAFDWPIDWPEQLAEGRTPVAPGEPVSPSSPNDVVDRLDKIERVLQVLSERAAVVVGQLNELLGVEPTLEADEPPRRDRQAPSTPNH